MEQKSPEAFRTISEVAEWLGVPTHVLRFWESRFSQVKPVKRAGGRRYYRPADMELLGGIRKLLHEDGMTIRGVQKLLREQGVKHVAAMSPPLDLGADAEDITPSNVVDLSERRTDEAADIEAWSPDPDAEWTAPDTSPPAEEPDAFWTGSDEPVPEDDNSASPEGIGLHPQDGEVDSPEVTAASSADHTAPEPDQKADPADPMDSPEALGFAAHDAEPAGTEVAPDPPAPAPEPVVLVMPAIGADPEDAAFEPDCPPTAAQLRAARAARADLPVATLQALAERLGSLASRIGADSSPRR